MSAGVRLTAIGAALVCVLCAIYLAVNRGDAARLRDANDAGSQSHYRQALALAERVSHAPANGRALLVEAYALRGLGRSAAASSAFARAARRDPNNWVIHRDWSIVLARRGERAQARREFARALELNPLMLAPEGSSR